MEPGPVDPSVLTSQSTHRSETAAEDGIVLDCMDHFAQVRGWAIDDARVQTQLARAGFLHYSRLDYIRLDRPLITSLVERWRPETFTFHLRVGEMTITLQDVAVLLGLRIDGPAVISRIDRHWQMMCLDLLGRAPMPMSGGKLKLTWLRKQFPEAPGPDATVIQIEQYTRAYILHHIGTSLFPDCTKSTVHCRWLTVLEDLDACGALSWGSAVLAMLYSEMSAAALKERDIIGGCLTLLQIWSWSRLAVGIPSFAPQQQLHPLAPLGYRFNVDRTWDKTPDRSLSFYRNEFDMLAEAAVVWRPYDFDTLHALPAICTEGDDIWRSQTTLICFHIISLHMPDRVLRQFDLSQHIPEDSWQYRAVPSRGRARANWTTIHAQHIERWNSRTEHIVMEVLPRIPLVEYHRWYWRITRRFILTECQPIFAYAPHGPVERDMEQCIYQIEDIAYDSLIGAPSTSGYKAIIDIIRGLGRRHSFRRPDGPIRPTITYTRRPHTQGASGASQEPTHMEDAPRSSQVPPQPPLQQATTQTEDAPGSSQVPTTQPQDVLGSSQPQYEDTPSVPRRPRTQRKRTPHMLRCLR